MLENFNTLLKELRRLDLIVEDSFFIPNIGKVKSSEAPLGLDRSFKKIALIDILSTDRNYLRELQSDAVNDIMMLKKEQLENCLNRLNSFDTFSQFYKFWGGFYVKYSKGECDNRDLFYFKMTLEGYFTVRYPENGELSFDFIHDLQDEIFLKNGVLHGLIFQINEILNPNIKEDTQSTIQPHLMEPMIEMSLQGIFNEPYRGRYKDFLRLLNTAVEKEVLDSDLNYINTKGNIGFIGQYFIRLNEKGVVRIKIDNENYSLLISDSIKGMCKTKGMLHNKGNQKYTDASIEIERQLEKLIESITK